MISNLKVWLNAKHIMLASAIMVSCKENVEIYQEDDLNNEEVREYVFFEPDNPLNVSSCDAEVVACAFMQSDKGDNNQKAANISYSVQNLTIIPDENMEPAMYVINLEPDGFCIVSATKQIEPILAYCDEGSFDIENMSSGLVNWMYEEMEKIQYARNDTSYASPEMVASIWHKYTNINDKRRYALPGSIQQVGRSKGPLLKTIWGQGYPYNYYADRACPNLNDTEFKGKYPVGCVATAMAQILKYYSYPANKYKWGKMKNTYDYYSLMDEGAKSMAEMFRDIDGLLKMNFDCEGSISETYYIPDILKSEFNYASGGTYQILSIEDAQPLVTSEILAGRPVIMDGYNTHTIKTTGKLFWKKIKMSMMTGIVGFAMVINNLYTKPYYII